MLHLYRGHALHLKLDPTSPAEAHVSHFTHIIPILIPHNPPRIEPLPKITPQIRKPPKIEPLRSKVLSTENVKF